MHDAAEAVRVLRSEGKTVLLHCVHAETRTPLVAAAYGAPQQPWLASCRSCRAPTPEPRCEQPWKPAGG